MATLEDDDDDFQIPSKAFSVFQSRILSSLGDSCVRSPKNPDGGARPRKRQRKPAAAANRKGEIGTLGHIGVGAKLGSTSNKEEELATEERMNLSLESCSGSVNSYVSSSYPCVPLGCDPVMTFDGKNALENETHVVSALTNSKVMENVTERGGIKISEGFFYSNSPESRFLGSNEKLVSNIKVSDCLIEDGCEDLEAGAQLNELMNLCCEKGDEDSSHGGTLVGNELGGELTDFQPFCSVECPLCGKDITNLNDELRQLHSNDCLDKVGTLEAPEPISEMKSSSSEEVIDISPVIQWLQSLGLSKYKEIFVKEEIDWETLQSLTEEDLLNIGVDALGPRKKIVNALTDLRKANDLVQDLDKHTSAAATDLYIKRQVPGNKLITEYFQGSSKDRSRVLKQSKPLNGKDIKDSAPRRFSNGHAIKKGKFRDIPPWCCIPGAPFRVDSFRYLRGDCSHWFLTHFHMDHYQGLTKNFCHGKIYCSSITANLVNMKIGVPWERLHILPLNQKITVAGVGLTCFDANHCPGAIIILFEPTHGKAVLHTGDFRFSEQMMNNPMLQSCHIHTLILDTTYCNPQYDFPKQETVIQFVIDAIQAEAFNPKTLFLIGSYTIGKERLYMEVARLLKKKVYVGAAKLRLLRHLELPEEDMRWFTANEMESHIHVVPMWTLASFKRMKFIANQYSARFNLIVAISPTGWSYGKGKKKTPGRRWQQGTIIRYEVPYSEHSSFTELREFVRFISPDHIIPSVNNVGPESADAMIALLMSEC